jgi:Ca2+/Na+ antiporter
VPPSIAGFDIWIMFAITLFFVPWMMWRGAVGRPLGAVFLVLYGGYVALQYLGMSGVNLAQG